MRYNDNQSIREFDINVNSEFEKVDARVLQAPTLTYGNGQTFVSKGVWRLEKRFLNPSSMDGNKWSVISLDGYIKDQDMKNLCDFIKREGSFFF